MKKIFFTVAILLSAIACDLKKDTDTPNEITIEDESIEESIVKEKEVEVKAVIKETKKVSVNNFLVTEEKLSGSISNVLVTSQNNDTFKLEEVDPIFRMYNSDLNKDGLEELFLITQSTGSGSYGTIYGFNTNKDKTISEIIVPEISQSDLSEGAVFFGYLGHDSIYMDNNKLFRKFPIYKPEDKNCCPTGGDNTIQYVLKSNKSYWRLEIK